MKNTLLILSTFVFTITALQAQVLPAPAPVLVDPAEAAAISSLLPPSLAAYGSLILVMWMIVGRAYKALKANGGLQGIYNGIFHGTNVPLIIGALCLFILPSCLQVQKLGAALSTPEARQVEVDLAKVGLLGAVAGGIVSPGDAITIANGVAVITSADSTSSKVVQLEKLGLDTAVAKGVVKPGDVVQITETSAILTPAPAPIPPSNVVIPTVVPTTSGK